MQDPTPRQLQDSLTPSTAIHNTWLQVMHGRLKHLIISSEVIQKKKKAEYSA